jgi:hypothetical protein
VLASGETVSYSCYVFNTEAAAYKWEFKYGTNGWQTFSDKAGGEWTIPHVQGVVPVSLRLTVTDKEGKSYTTTVACEIASRAHVVLINPAPGTELLKNEEVELEYRVYDENGKELPRNAVTFYIKDNDKWEKLRDRSFRAPRYEGTLYLKAEIKLAGNTTQEEIYSFAVVSAWSPYWVYFWNNPDKNCSWGEREAIHHDGRKYGFSRDLHDRYERFWVKDENRRLEEKGCVLLDGRESFVYRSGQGSFKVNLAVYVDKGKTIFINVNGKSARVENRDTEARLYSVELEVAADDGAIRVSGSDGTGLVELKAERLSGAPSHAAPKVSLLSGVKILGKY